MLHILCLIIVAESFVCKNLCIPFKSWTNKTPTQKVSFFALTRDFQPAVDTQTETRIIELKIYIFRTYTKKNHYTRSAATQLALVTDFRCGRGWAPKRTTCELKVSLQNPTHSRKRCRSLCGLALWRTIAMQKRFCGFRRREMQREDLRLDMFVQA